MEKIIISWSAEECNPWETTENVIFADHENGKFIIKISDSRIINDIGNDFISLDLNDMRKHSAVSDILQGISQGNIQGVAGHDIDYWRNPDNLPSEACAHMFEAQFDKTRYNEMKKYFPNSLLKFEEILKGAVGA